MIIKAFTSYENPQDAIERADKTIQEMKKKGYSIKQIAQSESTYYSTIQESKEFHFTLTILFVLE